MNTFPLFTFLSGSLFRRQLSLKYIFEKPAAKFISYKTGCSFVAVVLKLMWPS